MKKIITLLAGVFYLNTNAQVCFSSVTNFAAGTNPYSVTSADFNGDGKADIASANFASNNVSVLLGTGTGSFSTVSYSAGTNPKSITSADFNGDGKADLATANSGASTTSILLGNGAGGFAAATTFTITGTNLLAVVSADFNGDSKADLAFADWASNAWIMLGTGTGSFGTPTNFVVGTINPMSLACADFNSDGKKDLVIADGCPSGNSLMVLLGTGTGNFSSPTNFVVGTPSRFVISADFNGDGKKDLVTASNGSSNISILLGTGTGGFGAAASFTITTAPNSICGADFNGDGKIDLAAADGSISILLNCTAVGINNFSNEQETSIYPNPTSDQFFIEATSTDKLNVDLYDANGRHVFSANVSDKSNINVTTLNEGIYSLTIKTAGRIINKKLVILR